MNRKKHICTYFDYNFLPRGLALINSIRKCENNFCLYVLAFDEKTSIFLHSLAYPELVVISYSDYNSYFNTSPEKYVDIKQYYFSSTPNLCIYVLEKFQNIDVLLYLDADVFVYQSLSPIYLEFENYSIGFCSHRFHPLYRVLSHHYGKYNVGVNLFRNDEFGLNCLLEWKNDCDSWYSGKPGYPLSFFSDQIFLDDWPNRYKKVKIIENIGVNVAPWNAVNYKFKLKDGKYFVNDSPLIIYHFSSLHKINNKLWTANSIYSFASIKGVLLKLYKEYIDIIESFGISNQNFEKLTNKEKFIKKIYKSAFKVFINEYIRV